MAEQFPALTPEQVAEFRKKAGIPDAPETPQKSKSKEEKVKEEVIPILVREIDNARADIQSSNSRLFNMQKPNASRRFSPGVVLPSFNAEQIKQVEDNLLGNKIRFQCLEESLSALTNNQPLPADLRATLQILESQSDPGSARQKNLHALLIQLP